jgi:hypothetical protein
MAISRKLRILRLKADGPNAAIHNMQNMTVPEQWKGSI